MSDESQQCLDAATEGLLSLETSNLALDERNDGAEELHGGEGEQDKEGEGGHGEEVMADETKETTSGISRRRTSVPFAKPASGALPAVPVQADLREEHGAEGCAGGGSDAASWEVWGPWDRVAMLAAVVGMLREDIAMQVAIVGALQPDTPSEELDSYVTFWTLRPFIDERIVKEFETSWVS
eukprot:TRINITY_DN33668_c0_g1_i1.p1 TRINITY_DN33668_c0_g1~~TRINITY_DN33668_c0_g1_i1.p1  ORF type:complete len:182 (-),score=52.39 TRINITY_DN33668_c0_g1_i1:378-923(-)